MTTLIFAFLIIFAAVAFYKLEKAALLLIALLPAYLVRFSFYGLPLTVLEAMILILTAIFIIKNPPKRLLRESLKSLIKKPFLIESLLVLAISAIAVSYNLGTSSLGTWKAYFLEPILLFWIITSLFKTETGAKNIIAALGISAFFTAVFAVYQKITGDFIGNSFWAAEATRRVVSWYPYPNAVGLFLGPIIVLALGRFWSFPLKTNIKDNGKKLFYLTTIVLSILAIFFAHSEGALIALLVSFGAFFVFSGKKGAITMGTILCLVILITGLYKPIQNYVVEKATLMDLSGQIRKQQWKETWQMLENGRLITGAGLNGYQAAIKPFHQEGIFVRNNDPDWLRKVLWNKEYREKMWQPVEIYLYPHNIALNFWSELGLVGLLIFVWLIIKQLIISFRHSHHKNNQEKFLLLGLGGAMITIVIHGLVDVPYFKNDLSVLFWLIISLTIILTNRKSNI